MLAIRDASSTHLIFGTLNHFRKAGNCPSTPIVCRRDQQSLPFVDISNWGTAE
jgi:hypothetical protein